MNNAEDMIMRLAFEVAMGWRCEQTGEPMQYVRTNLDGSYRITEEEHIYQGYKLAHVRLAAATGQAITDATEQMVRQRKKGLKKYPTAIEQFAGTPLDLAQHAFEESCDQTVYLAELVRRLRDAP